MSEEDKRWKVALIWEPDGALEVLIDDRRVWKHESGRENIGVQDFLMQLEELDRIVLRSYNGSAEYLEEYKART